MGRNLAFRPYGTDIFLVRMGGANPTDEEWTEWLDFVKKHFWAASQCPGLLIMSGGGGPTPAQRERLNKLTAGRAYRMSLVTGSAIVRGVATAINWFHRQQMRAFSPTQLDAALKHLGVEGQRRAEARAVVDQLSLDLTARAG